ncbi:MAG: hypothetical protein IPL65_21205 [Lewinellaceae bacterium]|nr:hypothetical protein [Lewinellaceae bacterium]
MSESFLSQFLTPLPDDPDNSRQFLTQYINEWIQVEGDAETQRAIRFKILHTLQNFFIFLTYRSNGSPKKLIELVERYLIGTDRPMEKNKMVDLTDYVVKLNDDAFKIQARK